MAKTEKKQESQAADEAREEVLELENEDTDVDVSGLKTPGSTKTSGSKHIERSEAAADEAAEEPTDSKAPAKAGRRSAKAIREEESEAERKEAAAAHKEEAPKPKVVHVPNVKKRHGKNYLASAKLVDKTMQYELAEAIELAQKTSKTKFDGSVELHVNLGVDPRQADQMVRSTVTLPAGTGKTLRVAVFAPYEKHDEAKKAGADIVSDGDLVDKIDKGQLNFDVLIATPDMMGKLSKAAKVLGPRGLMPNPKSGTVTPNIGSAVQQAKAGKVEFRIDKQAIVHLAIGKASFKAADLENNTKAVIDAIMKAKPGSAKGTYVKAMTLTTSMGPGIKLDVQKAIAAANPKK
jgi:large subunit ribosomal protein L1